MTSARIVWLDIARTIAIVGMVIFHFCYDLALFGLIPAATVSTGLLRGLAIVVAASFIGLAGVSLQVAHGDGIKWVPFGKRLGLLVLAATAISLLTYLWMPQSFIFFGILHAIATFSVIGLAFLRLPSALTFAAALLVLVAPAFIALPIFDTAPLRWIGLGTSIPITMDYEPLFPWFAAFLCGMAFVRTCRGSAIMSRSLPSRLSSVLSLPGRYSLWIYLAHQPILIAMVWAGVQVFS